MFENTTAYKRVVKKKNLLDALAKANEEQDDWKIKQIEGKLATFNQKYYSRVSWDSGKQGNFNKKRRKRK